MGWDLIKSDVFNLSGPRKSRDLQRVSINLFLTQNRILYQNSEARCPCSWTAQNSSSSVPDALRHSRQLLPAVLRFLHGTDQT